MEKLQAAIEKARAQRQEAQPARKPAPDASGEAVDLWSVLRPVDVTPQTIRKNRLVARNGGHDAAPFDMLRTRILQQAREHDWKRVAIVSPHSACGKTTTVANLVFSFGRQTDLNVVALDLDMRRAELAKVLGLTPENSVGDLLEGRVAFSDHGMRYGPNVALGLSGKKITNSSEILQSQRTQDVLDDIQYQYGPDLMLFDMPPLIGNDDNFGFLKNVDCALLLVEAEKTTTKQIDLAERQLAELTNVIGIVLNKSRYADETYGYG